MLQKPEVHPDSVNGRLADDPATTKEVILGRWSQGVRCNPAIFHAETLNAVALKSHVPQIREELIDFLLRYCSVAVAWPACNVAEDLWSQSSLRGRFSQGQGRGKC